MFYRISPIYGIPIRVGAYTDVVARAHVFPTKETSSTSFAATFSTAGLLRTSPSRLYVSLHSLCGEFNRQGNPLLFVVPLASVLAVVSFLCLPLLRHNFPGYQCTRCLGITIRIFFVVGSLHKQRCFLQGDDRQKILLPKTRKLPSDEKSLSYRRIVWGDQRCGVQLLDRRYQLLSVIAVGDAVKLCPMIRRIPRDLP